MAYGLDIGSGVLTGVTDGDEPSKSEPLVAVPVPAGSLESAGLSLASAVTVDVDDTTYAVGSDASAIADATGDEPDELFTDGTPVDGAYTRPALEALVDAVLPERADSRGCYTTAGTVVGREPAGRPETGVESAFADPSVEWTPIDRGFAVVYDQLGSDNYTGLGICIDRQVTSVALAYYGVPALAFSIPYGGEWLVERAAADTGAAPDRVAAVLEEFALDPSAATGEIESALARAYDALVGEIADTIRGEADASDLQPGLAIPIALGGERAAEGVEHLIGGRFDAGSLPFSVRGVRLADEPAESAARGALAAARDGVTGDAGIAVDDPSEAARSSEAGTADDGVTLSFDESLDRGRETDPADAAVDKLFDRLADRDGEIQSITADLETLADEVDSVGDRSASAADLRTLEANLETVADDLAALEAEADTHASDEAVEALETSLEDLSADLGGIEDSVSALDVALAELATTATSERNALAEEVATLETDLEDVTDRSGDLETDLEELRTALHGLDERAATAGDLESLDDHVRELTGNLTDVDERIDHLSARTDEVEEHLGEETSRIDDVSERLEERSERTDSRIDGVETALGAERERLEGRLDDLRDAVDEYRSAAVTDDRVETIDDAIESLRRDVESLESEGQSVATARDALRADLEEELDETRTNAAETRDTLERVRTSTDDNRDAIAALRRDLERTPDDAAEADAVSDLRETVTTVRESIEATDEAGDELADEIETLGSRLDALETEVADRTAAVESTVDERTSEQAARLEERAQRVDALAAEVDELAAALESSDGRSNDHSAEIDALRADLEAVRPESAETSAVVPTVVAGGGGAGLVAGATVALAGATTVGVGAVVLGVLLLGGAVLLER